MLDMTDYLSRASLEMTSHHHAEAFGLGENEVIFQRQIDCSANLLEPLCCHDIRSAGRTISGRVIMGNDEIDRTEFKSARKQPPAMQDDVCTGSLSDILVRDVALLPIQEDRMHTFVAKVTETAAQIPSQRRVRAVDLRAGNLLA